jgi:alkanesulfonate monooxygenase SsuD/methylene tetrahydromethanopterin reductase-like flavin-dependent oxidoreductase (luciferase family)
VVLAKTLATIDALSGGRLIFGAGVGWDQQELDACQIDRATRGRRMDEMLDVILGLWTQESFSYEGRHFRLRDVRLDPRPIQRPHPPIWLAGGSVPPGTSQHITAKPGYAPERSMRRVARVGDALMSAYRSVANGDATHLRHDREVLDSLLREVGRDPSEVTHAIQDHMYISLDGSRRELEAVVSRFTFKPYEEIAPYYLIGTPDEIVPKLQARIDAGISEIDVNFIDRSSEQLDLFMRHIRPRLV